MTTALVWVFRQLIYVPAGLRVWERCLLQDLTEIPLPS